MHHHNHPPFLLLVKSWPSWFDEEIAFMTSFRLHCERLDVRAKLNNPSTFVQLLQNSNNVLWVAHCNGKVRMWWRASFYHRFSQLTWIWMSTVASGFGNETASYFYSHFKIDWFEGTCFNGYQSCFTGFVVTFVRRYILCAAVHRVLPEGGSENDHTGGAATGGFFIWSIWPSADDGDDKTNSIKHWDQNWERSHWGCRHRVFLFLMRWWWWCWCAFCLPVTKSDHFVLMQLEITSSICIKPVFEMYSNTRREQEKQCDGCATNHFCFNRNNK